MSIRAKFNKNTILTKCRVCLLNSGVWWMFSSYGKNNIDLKEMYEFCTGLKVQEEDSYPKSMCNNCIDSLIETHSFLVKCQTACSAMESINNILALKEPDLYNVVVDIGDSNVIFEYDGTLEDQAQDNFTNNTTGTVYESNVLSEDLINPANNICIDAIKEESEDNIEADTRTENENSILDGMDDEGEDINKDLSNEPNSDCDEGNDSDYIEYENEEQQIPNDSKNKICPICSKGFKRNDTLNNHLRTHTREKPFECKECPAKFSSTCNLIRHARIHSGEKPYVCDICGKAFEDSTIMDLHIENKCVDNVKKKTGGKPYKTFLCTYCGITLISNQNYIKHLLKAHSNKQVTNGNEEHFSYLCKLCGRYLATKAGLRTHMAIHKDKKDYLCDYCGKQFLTKGVMDSHMSVHTGDRPYKCIYCEKSFSQRSTLISHQYIHNGTRPYQCDFCSKGFKQTHQLQFHLRTHTGEKLFSCEICDKKMSTKRTLREHMRIHTGESPYNCTHCDRRFRCYSGFTKHRQIHERTSDNLVLGK